MDAAIADTDSGNEKMDIKSAALRRYFCHPSTDPIMANPKIRTYTKMYAISSKASST